LKGARGMSKGNWVAVIAAAAVFLGWLLYPIGRYQVVSTPGTTDWAPGNVLVDTRSGQTWGWSVKDRAWVRMNWKR